MPKLQTIFLFISVVIVFLNPSNIVRRSEEPVQESAKANQKSKALLKMASDGNEAAVKALLIVGADANAKDNGGRTALMYAASYYPPIIGGCGCSCVKYNEAAKALPTVQVLLDAHADVNAKDNQGKTALMLAAATGNNLNVVKLLITARADVNIKDNDGHTALMIAKKPDSFCESTAIMQVLKAAGAIDQ